MNINLPKLSVMLALLLLPGVQWAQSAWLEVTENIPYVYEFESRPNSAGISIQPQHGTAVLVNQTGSYMRRLTYTPDPDFLGFDTMRLTRWTWSGGGAPSWQFLDVYIEVVQAIIHANHDYAVTNASQAVTVNVLTNDFSSNGIKQLVTIPLVNNGTATLAPDGQSIVFTPNAGFSGLAHLNYVLCNGIGNCDEGTLSVSVMGQTVPATDTIKVFTRKNETAYILAPWDYVLLDGPDHGIFDPATDVPTYTPNTGYAGMDYLTFDNGQGTTVFAVEVLNLADNTFAFDDRFYTVAGQLVEFNVLTNDDFGSCLSFTLPEHGTLVRPPGTQGIFEYTPVPGFIGVDKFTYTTYPPGCAGSPETATVYLFVSNFEPSFSEFDMATPKLTPIIIGYNVPVATFSFSVSLQGSLGTAMFLDGPVDTLIYGYQITGDNMLIYVPHAHVDRGTDEFEITYCLEDPQGGCATEKTVKINMEILDLEPGTAPPCVGECVWAGDTNFDGIVNMEDLLPVGLSMGSLGKPRDGASFNHWYGQYADDWSNLFTQANGVDLKHIDSDGDSIVTALDTTAINLFYGRTHSMVPRQLPFTSFEIVLEGDLFVEPGDLVTLNVKIGSPQAPAHNVYGFVLPFPYDTTFFVASSVNMQFYAQSWLNYDSPVLHMKHNNGVGLLEAGFTRTSGRAASGYGEVGAMSFIVVDDLQGFRPDEEEILLTLGGEGATVMDGNGQSMGVYIRPYTLRIRLPQNNSNETAQTGAIDPSLLKVFPNPASSLLTVHLNGNQVFEEVNLFNLTGQRVQNYTGLATNHAEFNVSRLPAGIYLLSVTTPQGVINRKVEVVR